MGLVYVGIGNSYQASGDPKCTLFVYIPKSQDMINTMTSNIMKHYRQ